MLVELAHPNLVSGLGIDGVGVGAAVTEVERISRRSCLTLVGCDSDCGAHAGLRAEDPVQASACCVQRKDVALFAGCEQPAGNDGWLGASSDDVGQAKRPFQLELGHVSRRKPSYVLRLIARVRDAAAPAVPVWT